MKPWSDSPLCESASAGGSCHGSGLSDVLQVSVAHVPTFQPAAQSWGRCSSGPWLFAGAQAVTSALLWKDRSCLAPQAPWGALGQSLPAPGVGSAAHHAVGRLQGPGEL